VTASASATATAASTAVPPFFKIMTPTSAASGETQTTMPRLPVTTVCFSSAVAGTNGTDSTIRPIA
jgi:hypothetical protein